MFDKNLSFFKKNDKRLHSILSSEFILDNIKLEKVESEDNYIIENGFARCFMHSVYSVQDEMAIMFKDVKEDTDTIILYGLGCGYSLEYIVNNYPNLRYLLVIEPSIAIFKELAKNFDLTEIYKRIKFVKILVQLPVPIVIPSISDAITKSKKVSFVHHVTYSTIFSDEYRKITKYAMEQIKFLRDGLILAKSSIYPWLINGIKNLKKNSIPVEDIIKLFENRTVILVGAGPSLNKNIHLLKDAKSKAVIIAGGSAIKILDSHNIKPDFRIAIDGLMREKKILEGIDINDIPLLLTNNLYYEIADEYKGPLIRFINRTEYIGKYVYRKASLFHMDVDSGSSVINSALSLVCQAKCKEVVFIGQNLSYTEGERYAKGSNFSKLKHNFNSSAYKKMKDTNGDDVYTTDSMLTMKYSLEGIIRKFPGIRFTNATEGGLPIEGTEVRTLWETLDEIPEEIDFDVYNFVTEKTNSKEYMDKIHKALQEMKKEVEELLSINNEIYKLIKKVESDKNSGKDGVSLLRDLQNIEKFNERLRNNSFYNEVVVNALKTIFKAVIVNFEYNGSDVDKKVESVLKISLNRVVEAQKYATLANEILNDQI